MAIKHLSQRDPKWGINRLGTCSDTIFQSGCVITSLAMLANTTPDEVNELFIKKKGYTDGCIVIWTQAAKLLDLKYSPVTSKAVFYPCIAETDFYAKRGVPQHFFVLLEDGTILDPLDRSGSKPKKNIYPIKNFRNITKEQPMETYKAKLGNKEYDYNALQWAKSAVRYHGEVGELKVALTKAQKDLELEQKANDSAIAGLELKAKDLEEKLIACKSMLQDSPESPLQNWINATKLLINSLFKKQ